MIKLGENLEFVFIMTYIRKKIINKDQMQVLNVLNEIYEIYAYEIKYFRHFNDLRSKKNLLINFKQNHSNKQL